MKTTEWSNGEALLSGMIEVFQYRQEKWQHLSWAAQGMKLLPDASAIRLHPTNPMLYAASRKESCIAVYALDPEDYRRSKAALIPGVGRPVILPLILAVNGFLSRIRTLTS